VSDLWAALCLVLVIEGLFLFAAPAAWKRMVAQLIKVGKMPVQFELGGRYYLDAPTNGPEWGLRFKVTMLFPR